jgi:hypothetical protein
MCPPLRTINQRLTGTVTKKAMNKATAKLHQNIPFDKPAAKAPGIRISIKLSTISIEVIDTVSVANVVLIASLLLNPARVTE